MMVLTYNLGPPAEGQGRRHACSELSTSQEIQKILSQKQNNDQSRDLGGIHPGFQNNV